MDKIKEALTRKIGPLPGWAWGVMVGGGIWVWRAFKGTTLGPTDEASQQVEQVGIGLVPSAGGGYGGSTGVPPDAYPSYGQPGGEGSPLYVSTPGGAYVEGSASDVQSILEIIAGWGGTSGGGSGYIAPAPQPVAQPVATAPVAVAPVVQPTASVVSAPAPVTPTPTPAPAPNPIRAWYTVVRGDTLGGIASKYGITGTTARRAFFNFVKPYLRSGNPDLIYPGERIPIPA